MAIGQRVRSERFHNRIVGNPTTFPILAIVIACTVLEFTAERRREFLVELCEFGKMQFWLYRGWFKIALSIELIVVAA
jgi:hypothetical protein